MNRSGANLRTAYTIALCVVLLSACPLPFHEDLYGPASATPVPATPPPAAPTYTVTYDGNGNTAGTVPLDSKTYVSGATVIIAGAGTMVNGTLTFTGWNTAANGTGVSHAAASNLTMGSASIRLYAVWTALPTYTVTYNGNGSLDPAPTDSNNYLPGAAVLVASQGTMVNGALTFAGWNTASDGTGVSHAAGSSFTIGSASVVLYAVWTALPTYTVTYDGNGSLDPVPIDGNLYLTGATVTVLPPGILSLTGNVFGGWNTALDGSGTTYSGGDTFTMGAGSVTLHAMWLAVTGTIITSVPLNATAVVIPAGVTDFGTAFYNHPNLVSVTIPASVNAIAAQAFLDDGQLATIVSNNTRYQVINGALVDTATGRLMLVPAKLNGAFVIPTIVTSIDGQAFSYCTNLTSITFAIPPALSSINGNAFTDLHSAVSIVLPSTVTYIADFAFYRSSFTSITIPATVSTIGANTMGASGSLTDVYVQRTTPPTLGLAAFTAPFPTIHVPDSTAQALYQANTSWNIYGTITTP